MRNPFRRQPDPLPDPPYTPEQIEGWANEAHRHAITLAGLVLADAGGDPLDLFDFLRSLNDLQLRTLATALAGNWVIALRKIAPDDARAELQRWALAEPERFHGAA